MFLSRTSPLMFGLLGAIALHLSPVVAVADDVVHACVKEATGAVRLVKTDTECRPYETAVAWARRGPAGQRGQTGAPGEAGRSIILKDAAGGRVGILIDLLNTSMALVLSDRNYTVLLETGDESLVLDKELVFDDPECGGTPAFLLASRSFYALSRNFGTRGEVFALRPTVPDALSGLGYIPRDAALVSGDFFLRDSGGRCVATSGSGGYRVLANDPALTGVSRGVYPGPLSFGKE